MRYPSRINSEADRRAEEVVQRNFQQVQDCLCETAPGHLSGPYPHRESADTRGPGAVFLSTLFLPSLCEPTWVGEIQSPRFDSSV